ncbi:MAG: hypothetical protein H6925_06375 [Holosporaceae bacterium]|nr:MAG: hypothetical protein H6925_06375 [Holosporaceae bacterium]
MDAPILNHRTTSRAPSAVSVSENLPTARSTYCVGECVFHVKFGYGIIKNVDSDRLLIDFDHAGPKKFFKALFNGNDKNLF